MTKEEYRQWAELVVKSAEAQDRKQVEQFVKEVAVHDKKCADLLGKLFKADACLVEHLKTVVKGGRDE